MHILKSIGVGLLVGLLTALVGVIVGQFAPSLGSFIYGLALLLGLIAGVYYFITGKSVIQ